MPFPAVPSFLLPNKAPAAVPSFLKKRSTPSGVDAAASSLTGSPVGNSGDDSNDNNNSANDNSAESPADERVGPQSAVRSTDTHTIVGGNLSPKAASTPPATPEGRSNANAGITSSGVRGVSGCGQAAAPMNRVALVKDNDRPSSSGCGGDWDTTAIAAGSVRPLTSPFIINQVAQGTVINSNNTNSSGNALVTNPLNTTVLGGDGGAPRPILAERFKTRQCRNYLSTGACPYEARCMFAHGDSDVRTYEENLRDGLISEEAILEWRHARQLMRGGQGAAVAGGAQMPPPPAYDVSVNVSPCSPLSGGGGGGGGGGVVGGVPLSYEMGVAGTHMSTVQNGSVGIPIHVNSGTPHNNNRDLQECPYPTMFRHGEDVTRPTSLVNEEYNNTAHVFARGHAVEFSGHRQQEGLYASEGQPRVPIPYVFSQPSNPSLVHSHHQYRHADGEYNYTSHGFSNPPSAREEKDIAAAQLSSARAAGGVSFFYSNKADIGSRNASSRSASSAAAIGGYGPGTSAPTAGPYPNSYPHAYPASHATGVQQRNGTTFANSHTYAPLSQSVPSYPSPSAYPPIISTAPDPACIYGSGTATGLSFMPPHHPSEDIAQHIVTTASTRTNTVVGLPTMATVASSDTATMGAYAANMTAGCYYNNDTRRIAGSSSFIVSSRAEYASGRPDDVGAGVGGEYGGFYTMHTSRATEGEEEPADYFAHEEEDGGGGGHNQPNSTAADLIGFLSLLSTNATNTDPNKKGAVPPHSRNEAPNDGGQQHSYYYSLQEAEAGEQQNQPQGDEGDPFPYHLSPEVSGLLSRGEGGAASRHLLDDHVSNGWGAEQPLSSMTNEEIGLGGTGVNSVELIASHPIFGMGASKVNSVGPFSHSSVGEHHNDSVNGGYVMAMANSVGVVGDGSNYGSKRSQHP